LDRHEHSRRAASKKESEIADFATLFAEALTPPRLESKDRLTSLGALAGTPGAVDAAFDKLVDRLLPTIGDHLKTLAGVNLGVAENAKFAKAITRLLNRFGCSLICPHCKRLATLSYSKSGNAKTPVFRYRHREGFHGGTIAVTGPLEIVRGRPHFGDRKISEE
jgi:hypothetical protein